MPNKDWLLNAAALKAAKSCIKEVEAELGVRLRLTHPEFLQMLNDYAELCDSASLNKKVMLLNRFASPEERQGSGAVVPMNARGGAEQPRQASNQTPAAAVQDEERITYMGKSYPRFKDGKEFKGLYRGKPQYR